MRSSSFAHIGLLLAALLAAPTGIVAALSDIAGDANKTAIEYLQEHGIVDGYPDGTFHPERTVNRAELLKMLILSSGLPPDTDTHLDCFPDVTDDWFAPYVCDAKERGWVSGYDDGRFRPEQPVNTVEAIKMIVHAYGYEQIQSSPASPFRDVDPAAWYAPYVLQAAKAGILDATSGNLGTTLQISRGRLSDMVYRSVTTRQSGTRQDRETRSTAIGGDGRRTVRADGGTTAPRQANPRRGGGGGGGNRAESTGNAGSQRTLSSPAISLGNLAKTYGDSAFTIAATSDSTGNITYASSDTDVATVAGNTITMVGAGTTTITVTQEADGDYAAGSTTATLTVGKAECSATLASSNNPSQVTENVKLTASLTAGVTGIVTFSSGAVVLGSGSIAHSSGSLTITTLDGTGTGYLTATYDGDTNFNSCTSSVLTQRIYRNRCLNLSLCRNGGTCTNIGDGFSCSCVEPYSGPTCTLSDTFCNPDHGGTQCFNLGVCEPNAAGGSCDCASCYSGTFCDVYNPDDCV